MSPYRHLLNGHSPAETPCLVLDLDKVRDNVSRLKTAFAPLSPRIFYSVKASAEPSVLSVLSEMDCGFDVASRGEIEWLDQAGLLDSSAVCFSATVKVPAHVEAAFARGIDKFAFDCESEVLKLARLAPGSKVILRLDVPHMGSLWPLAGKFGAAPSEAVELLLLAARHGLEPYGLTFHVGSQCVRPDTWLEAIAISNRVWQQARRAGLKLRCINLGGGIPATYTEDVPAVGEIGEEVARRALETFGEDIQYAVEPGRYIVADAGTMITSVIGTAVRTGRPWVFVDLSIYAGLLEVTGGWSYPIVTTKDHLPKKRVTLAGPSCDSTDILALDVELPEMEVGDRLALLATGAYTTAYQAYNGLRFPQVLTVNRNRHLAELSATI